MIETLLEHFQGSALSLWGPFIILLLCGLGLPVPEDIILIAAGVLGQIDGHTWVFVSGVMYAGVLAGDTMIFFAGRFFGSRLLAMSWTRRMFSPAKQAKVEEFFQRRGTAGLFIGRFLPGLRAPIFFTAGSMKVPFLKFLLLDGTAALISVPFFVWLGHWLWNRFHADIENFNRALARTHSYSQLATIIIAVVVLTLVLIWLRRSRQKS
ncbi:MAG: DedA family protein [Opitutaceae bacterium]|nr:DedA family protein [Opitutaceae bacterium]